MVNSRSTRLVVVFVGVVVAGVNVGTSWASWRIAIFLQELSGYTKSWWRAVIRPWLRMRHGLSFVFLNLGVEKRALFMVEVKMWIGIALEDRVVSNNAGRIWCARDALHKVGSPSLISTNSSEGASSGYIAVGEANVRLVRGERGAKENPSAPNKIHVCTPALRDIN